MTILPGHPIAEAPPPPSKHSRGPRTGIGGRTLALILAGVVAAGGGGAWFLLHSSDTAAPVAAVAHHPAVLHHPAGSGKLATPHTRAAAMAAATRIFTVLPAQLPGWQVSGKASFDTGHDGTDAVSRAAEKCDAAGNAAQSIDVVSPDLVHRGAPLTSMSVSVHLGFVRTPAAAAAAFAAEPKASVMQCIVHAVVGKTVPLDGATTLKFTSVRPLRVRAGAAAMQVDGQVSAAGIGTQPVRMIELIAVDRATEVSVVSVGMGAALPLATDLRILDATIAQARRVIA